MPAEAAKPAASGCFEFQTGLIASKSRAGAAGDSAFVKLIEQRGSTKAPLRVKHACEQAKQAAGLDAASMARRGLSPSTKLRQRVCSPATQPASDRVGRGLGLRANRYGGHPPQ